jgi:hypothetical protein
MPGPTDHFDAEFTKTYSQFVEYSAFDYAFTKPNITWRRDGVGGAVFLNQRRFCNEVFSSANHGPFICEFVAGYADAKKVGQNHAKWMIEDALSLHPNYINILGWQCADAIAFTKEQPELVNHALRHMGYRLVPIAITYPETIRAGENFTVTTQWENRGVGRAMSNLILYVSVVDDAGKTVGDIRATPLTTREWVKDQQYVVTSKLRFKNLPIGQYRVAIQLIEPQSGRSIQIPLKSQSSGGVYIVGPIQCGS